MQLTEAEGYRPPPRLFFCSVLYAPAWFDRNL